MTVLNSKYFVKSYIIKFIQSELIQAVTSSANSINWHRIKIWRPVPHIPLGKSPVS
nr:GH01616p [Drosophila melanogaster]